MMRIMAASLPHLAHAPPREGEHPLAALAEDARDFGTITAFDRAQQVVWVNITGCAHLYASATDPRGETTLATHWTRRLREGHPRARVAVADGSHVAAAVARFAPAHLPGPLVVPTGQNARALGRLPLAALPLEASQRRWLRHLGLRTVADLQRLPRSALGGTLGAQGPRLLALLAGDDDAPLIAYQPPEHIEERVEFDDDVTSTDAFLFVLRPLCERLAERLQKRAHAAAGLTVVLTGKSIRDKATVLPLTLAAPLTRADEFFRTLRARLEAYGQTPAAGTPFRSLRVQAHPLVARPERKLFLFSAEAKSDATLARLVSELTAELGAGRVGLLSVANCWQPEHRSELVPYRSHSRATPLPPFASLLTPAPEPTRVLPQPIAYAIDPSTVRGVLRLETTTWWEQPAHTSAPRRDFFCAWVPSVEAFGWGERRKPGDPLDRLWVRGWLDP